MPHGTFAVPALCPSVLVDLLNISEEGGVGYPLTPGSICLSPHLGWGYSSGDRVLV